MRAVGRIPRGHRLAISLVASLGCDGMGPAVAIPGAVDRIVFDAFVTEMLVPTLRPGQIVILDNLSVHTSARARAAIEAAGAELRFLPTYSPDFNPIEQAFAKLKQALRRAQGRNFDEVVSATGEAMQTITTHDAAGFYRAAGYPLDRQPL